MKMFDGMAKADRVAVRRIYRAWRTFHTKEYARIKATSCAYAFRTAHKYQERWKGDV